MGFRMFQLFGVFCSPEATPENWTSASWAEADSRCDETPRFVFFLREGGGGKIGKTRIQGLGLRVWGSGFLIRFFLLRFLLRSPFLVVCFVFLFSSFFHVAPHSLCFWGFVFHLFRFDFVKCFGVVFRFVGACDGFQQ